MRVARAAREMGIVPLGIYSEADAGAYHLEFVDDARCIGPPSATQSYLNADAIVAAALAMKADALHPGYGFLSERAVFARSVRDAGIVFVGPSPEAMAAMGSKIEAKRRVRAFDVPTVPGYDGEDQSAATLYAQAQGVGFPLMIKASAGGGGRGMRVVHSASNFGEALESAKREALAAFGDDSVLLERYLADPRHIEFQILADAQGTTIHLGERECSIQRRHQKIVEEAPSVAVTPALRAEMGAAAVRAAESVGYTNAGTAEFMLDSDGSYYFLEMNARLQVEHPVTELVYGIDLVHWQLRIAAGEPLTISQSDVQPRGWAIETRIYAEDPANDMLPSTGRIGHWIPPEGPGIRLDTGVTAGSVVSHYYDPMLAKLIVYGSDRGAAIARLRTALENFVVDGVATNLPLLLWIARDEDFARGETTTGFLARRLDESILAAAAPGEAALLCAAALLTDGRAPWRIAEVGMPVRLQHGRQTFEFHADANGRPGEWTISGARAGKLRAQRHGPIVRAELDGTTVAGAVTYDGTAINAHANGGTWKFALGPPPSDDAAAASHSVAGAVHVAAPMPGRIVKIATRDGDAVEEHGLLIVLEAMKMEHRIEAPAAATVKSVRVKEGQIVAAGTPLVEFAS